jgi:hypothetical protein
MPHTSQVKQTMLRTNGKALLALYQLSYSRVTPTDGTRTRDLSLNR